MAPVFAKLDHLSIEPLGATSQPHLVDETPLLDRVRRRAEILRTQWLAEKADEEQPKSATASGPYSFHPPPAKTVQPTSPSDPVEQTTWHVQIGDSVHYCYVDPPHEVFFVMIVESESDPALNLINRDTAVAKALLGMEVGQEREIVLPAGHRMIRVTEIRRHQQRNAPPFNHEAHVVLMGTHEGLVSREPRSASDVATRSGQLTIKGENTNIETLRKQW